MGSGQDISIMYPIRLSESIRFVEIRINKINHLAVMRLTGNSYALLPAPGRYLPAEAYQANATFRGVSGIKYDRESR